MKKLTPEKKRKLKKLRAKIDPWHATEAMKVFDVMVKAEGDKVLAAALLGIGKTTLYHKVESYGLQRRIDKAVARYS